MRETYKRIAEPLRVRGLTVMMQGEMSRTEMVKRFREDGNAVILGLKSFWAGVDIPGDALRLVVIDKLPFNSPGDVVWSALCDYVNRQAGDNWAWWNELAVPFMIVMLNQGYGRLIRTMTDVGIVAILDGRLRTKGYGKRIIRSLPPAPVIGSAQEVAAFWAQARTAR
jgi:ATP-dependent DNA helicase DinG